MFSRSIYRTLLGIQTRTSLSNSRQFLKQFPVKSKIHNGHTFHITRSYASMGRRPQASFSQQVRHLFRENPFYMTLASLCIAFGAGSLGYVTYVYVYDIAPINAVYPEPVANKLRRALWHMNIEPEPQKALNYYQEAIRLAQEHGMHPFSREVIGIKLKVAEVMGKFGQADKEIEVLEIIRKECEEFLTGAGDQLSRVERTRLLALTVRASIKIAMVYASDAVQNTPAAQQNLERSMEVMLKEEMRRQNEGVEPDENNEWLHGQEIGALFEKMAESCLRNDQASLAVPLYLRALSLIPRSCHEITLMTNLSMALMMSRPDSGPDYEAARHGMLENGKIWADKAIALAEEIKPPLRNEECDQGCVWATMNLGQIAELQNRFADAREHYANAASMAKAIDYTDGRKIAELSVGDIDGRIDTDAPTGPES